MTARVQADLDLQVEALPLTTAYPFGIARGSASQKTNLLVKVRYRHQRPDLEGLGEAAPSAFYGESAESCLASLATWRRAGLPGDNPFAIAAIMDKIAASDEGSYAARSALETALWDLSGKICAQPVYRLLGLDLPDRQSLPATSFTIAIDELTTIKKKSREAAEAGHQVLKVKLGTGTVNDRKIIECVRSEAPHLPIRVDANGGWSVKQALEMAQYLANQNVQLIEQPLPHTATPQEFASLQKQCPLPIFLDESVKRASHVPAFAGACTGVVVKLAKTGGLLAAMQEIATARACGMQVMFGCMIESSLGISAAAQLAPLCDYLDLDGALLLASDPFCGVTFNKGCLQLQTAPGLGVAARS